jgi:hypothetical protein
MLGIDDGLFGFRVHGSRLAGLLGSQVGSSKPATAFLTDWEGLRRLAARGVQPEKVAISSNWKRALATNTLRCDMRNQVGRSSLGQFLP